MYCVVIKISILHKTIPNKYLISLQEGWVLSQHTLLAIKKHSGNKNELA